MKRIYYIYRGATKYRDQDECWWTREFYGLVDQPPGSSFADGTAEAKCLRYLQESQRFFEAYCITDGSEGQRKTPPPGAEQYFPRENPSEPPRVDAETARIFGRAPEVVEPKAMWER